MGAAVSLLSAQKVSLERAPGEHPTFLQEPCPPWEHSARSRPHSVNSATGSGALRSFLQDSKHPVFLPASYKLGSSRAGLSFAVPALSPGWLGSADQEQILTTLPVPPFPQGLAGGGVSLLCLHWRFEK